MNAAISRHYGYMAVACVRSGMPTEAREAGTSAAHFGNLAISDSPVPFHSVALAKIWGIIMTDGPYSFLAEDHDGAVKRFTYESTDAGWAVSEVLA